MHRRSLETAADNYAYLRGLLFVPAGVVAILAALGNWQVGPLRHVWAFPVAVIVVGLATLPISRYYHENYGRVSPSTRQPVRGSVAVGIGIAVMLGGTSLLRSQASWSLDLPVNPIAVCFAVIMLVSYAIGVGLRTHHVIIWGALLIAGGLPVWTGAEPSNIGLILSGVAIILSGLFDHRLFVETFGAPTGLGPRESDVGA